VVAAMLPMTSASIGGSMAIVVNLVMRAPTPTSVYIALPQGPTKHIRLDTPDQGARGVIDRPLGTIDREINLTFSPLISTLLFNFILYTLLVSSLICI
jgi:hypothetical protein